MKRAQVKQKLTLAQLFTRVGLAAACLYLIGLLITAQVEIVAKRRALENLQQQLDSQTAQNTELRRTMEAPDEKAFLERVAREELGFVHPDERVYVDMSGK